MPGQLDNKAHVYSGASLAPDRSQGIVAGQVPAGSRVLELGPGSGVLTRHLASRLQCEVTVVEADPAASEALRADARQVITADIEDFAWLSALEEADYDVIVCADILEHLRDPWTVLRKTTGLLRKGGLVILSIPNISHSAVLIDLFNDRFTYRKWGILDDSHLRFFTHDGVLELLASARLCPIELNATYRLPEQTSFGTSYLDVPFCVAIRLARRPHAHVLQFIVTAMRVQDAEPGRSITSNLAPPAYTPGQHLLRVGRRILRKMLSSP